MDEKLLKLMIMQWLKLKANYVYFGRMNKEDTEDSVSSRIQKLLNHAQIHHDNLEAHECYFIKHLDDGDGAIIDHHKPDKRNYNFNNFNIPINECIVDIEHLYMSSHKIGFFDQEQFIFNVRLYMMQFIHSVINKNKFIESGKCLKLSYAKIFDDINSDPKSVINFSNIVNKSLWSKNNRVEFLYRYIGKSKKLTDNIIEAGIFYPFKIYNDIFIDKHYLVEINYIKFKNM